MKKLISIIAVLICIQSQGQNTLTSSETITIKNVGTNLWNLNLPLTKKDSTQDLQIKSLSDQTAVNQVDIAVLKTQVGTGGSYTPLPVKFVTASSYTVTQADNLQTIEFTSACNVYFTGLKNGFECYFIRAGGDVKFNGVKSGNNKIRLQFLNSPGKVKCDGSNIYLSGELKL